MSVGRSSSTTTLTACQRRKFLDGAEAKQSLDALLDVHLELSTEAARIAADRLAAVWAEGVAGEIAIALEILSVEDVWEPAGTHVNESYEGQAPNTREDTAHHTMTAWEKRPRGRASPGEPARELAAMRSFDSDVLPEWRLFLDPALGLPPARSRGRRAREVAEAHQQESHP